MKINRNNYAYECTEISLELESLKKRLFQFKNKEKLLDNGLTNFSKLYFELINLKINKNYSRLNIKISLGDKENEFEITNSNIGTIWKM